MKFPCPHCGQNLDAEPEWAGAATDCPTCGQPLVIPAPEEELPPPPPPPFPPPPAPRRPSMPAPAAVPAARSAFRPSSAGPYRRPAKKSGGGPGVSFWSSCWLRARRLDIFVTRTINLPVRSGGDWLRCCSLPGRQLRRLPRRQLPHRLQRRLPRRYRSRWRW
jgi:hypothetical protein